MSEGDLHEVFHGLVIDEPPLPDFLTVALERGRRRRRGRMAVMAGGLTIVVAVAVGGGFALSSMRGGSTVAPTTGVKTRLLAIADADAAACGGPARHVQVASSTRAVANQVTSGATGMDNRPVWVLLITGGPFNCPHTGPSNSPLPPASDQIIILDASNLQPTDGGFGDHDTLHGLGPITTLR
jgi:hypothetical protein